MSVEYTSNLFEEKEYVHVTFPNGESTRFNRFWGGHRFTDEEVEALLDGQYISINTQNTRGIIGSLDWLEYNGYDYYGFVAWDATAYERENAPFPIRWNNHEFTREEEWLLRNGDKLLLVVQSHRTGNPYPVHVSYDLIQDERGERWGIIPHFEEFEMPASAFTRETCLFNPVFGGKQLTLENIMALRKGESIEFQGIGKNKKPYTCDLRLDLDTQYNRWRLIPTFK